MNPNNTRKLLSQMSLALFAAAATAEGTTTWWASNAPCSTNPTTCGTSEANTCCRIYDAITRSSNGDTVLVKPGTYDVVSNFGGKAITVKSTDGPAVTTITHPLGAPKVNIHNGEGPSTVLEGFTLTGGYGSGLTIQNASPTIRGNIIVDNGQGIYMASSSALIDNNLISENHNTGNGGGMYVVGPGNPVVQYNIFSCNTAGTGAWIYAFDPSNLVVRDCVFRDNSATGDDAASGGGAIRIRSDGSGSVTIVRSKFDNNDASDYGGGLFSNYMTSAAGEGNPCPDGYLELKIDNSRFIGNTADDPGGAIAVGNCTEGTLTHCTFSRNNATIGPALFDYPGSGTFTITESILWGNATPGDFKPEIDAQSDDHFIVTYSDIEGGWAGVGNINADPLFFDPVSDNYHLTTGSPAIDAAIECDLTVTDLDANPRCVNGVEDMGAYEYPECTSDSDCDDQEACNGVEICLGGNCQRAPFNDCNCNGVQDFCEIMDGTSADCNANGVPDECEPGSPFPASLVDSKPAHDHSWWREQNNIARLTFACDVSAPTAGQVKIQELLPNGQYGSDLSSQFSLVIESLVPGRPRVLRIKGEPAAALEHPKWYAVRNDGWNGVAAFTLHFVNMVGDATDDNNVLHVDLGKINARVPTLNAEDDAREDITGDGRILSADVLNANAYVPSLAPQKPGGH